MDDTDTIPSPGLDVTVLFDTETEAHDTDPYTILAAGELRSPTIPFDFEPDTQIDTPWWQ